MTQLLVHLPEQLVHKFRSSVSAKQRSKYIEMLLLQSLAEKDSMLLASATALEMDADINELMQDFEVVAGDGL